MAFPFLCRLATGAVSSGNNRGGPEEALLPGNNDYDYEEHGRGPELQETAQNPCEREVSCTGNEWGQERNERYDTARDWEDKDQPREATRDGGRGGIGLDGGGDGGWAASEEARRPGWRQVLGSANFRAAAVVRGAHLHGLGTDYEQFSNFSLSLLFCGF